MMTAFYIWLGIAFFLFILELIISSSFALLCFSVGSLFAGLTSLCDLGIIWQLIVFTVFSLLSFLFIRPTLMKHLNKRSASRPKTNVEALIGRKARVTERIEGTSQPGRISLDGDIWQAVCPDSSVIEVGEWVETISIDSIIMNVKPIQS